MRGQRAVALDRIWPVAASIRPVAAGREEVGLFLFFPIRTDAPVYHFPWATIGLIIANVAAFALSGGFGDGQRLAQMWFDYGLTGVNGVDPLTWLTCHFLHADFGHLLGNMLFLWTFGLIVEGKIGGGRFLGFCLAIAIAGAIMVQVLGIITNDASRCAGFSLVISGLTPIAILWAPRNEIGLAYFLLLFFVVRIGVFDISVLVFAGLTILFDIVCLAQSGLTLSTPVGHLAGTVGGVVLGYAALRRGWVDCEGWDLLSLRGKRRKADAGERDSATEFGPSRAARRRINRRMKQKQERQLSSDSSSASGFIAPPPGPTRPHRAAKPTAETIREHLRAKRYAAALSHYQAKRHLNPKFTLPASEALMLAVGLDRAGQADDAIGLYEQVVAAQPSRAAIRLRVAKLLFERQSRPKAAIQQLDAIAALGDEAELSQEQRQAAATLRAAAQEQVDAGVIELRGQSW